MQERTRDKGLTNGMYFSYCDETEKKKHSVFVERSVSGIYDLPRDASGDCSTADILNDNAETKNCLVHKTTKILLFGIVASVLILCSVIFVIKFRPTSSYKTHGMCIIHHKTFLNRIILLSKLVNICYFLV